MYKSKVIVVDDQPDILELLEYNFSKEGFDVETFLNAHEALEHIRKKSLPDLILTDWRMPEIDGLEFCRSLKLDPLTAHLPVVMISCKNEEIDAVTALELGADDYMSKPFRIKELITRVKKIIRRTNPVIDHAPASLNDQLIKRGTIIIDPEGFVVKLGNKQIELTLTEFRILELLAKKPGKVFTRNQIISYTNGTEYFATKRSVDVQVVGLRKKMGEYKNAIETVRSVGYRFRDIY